MGSTRRWGATRKDIVLKRTLALLAATAAFFVIGLIIWAARTWKPEQVEKPEFRIGDDKEIYY